ncbi:MAG: hypothetical protein WC238_00635 [Parcubacteria group bacterium]|jgi:capsular polysaccharide biosynthesis protein
MELKEYIRIIKEHRDIFLVVVLGVIVAAFFVLIVKADSYSTSLLLSITRSGSQETADYKFDDFYRIQADEKFAETIVQWVSNPGIEADIFAAAGVRADNFSLRQLSKSFKAEKLSSQAVAVSFSAPSSERAQKIADSIFAVLEKNNETLNKDQKENGWFKIVAHDPIIVKNNYNPFLIFILALSVGLFLAFWTVLIIHYLK